MEMDISPQFRTKSKIKIKRQFDEGADDATIDLQSAEESFGSTILYLLLIKL
jgi:hypothetical protein